MRALFVDAEAFIAKEIVFINGKQKRIKREPTLDGMSADQFIRQNADPITLHQNEMWDEIENRQQTT